MDTRQSTRDGAGEATPKESLGRKLLRLLVQFCACLIVLPALFAGVGALAGLFVASPLRGAITGLIGGVVLGGIAFTVIANYYAGTPHNAPPGGAGGFGGGVGDGGEGSGN